MASAWWFPGKASALPTASCPAQCLRDTRGEWLATDEPLPAASFEVHFRLVAIHPFADGNGRKARLLMNALLLRDGYPPVAVRPEDRKTYLDTLEHGSLRDDLKPFQTFMHRRLDATLGEYLGASQEAQPPTLKHDKPGIPIPSH